MRDANRLRRLVWSGPAPAGVASRPRTRAASGLRLAANTGCPPGAGWRRPSIIRTVTKSAARRRKENAGRRAGGRHAFARRRADQGLSRHLARRPLALWRGHSPKLGRSRAARTMTA